MREEEGARYLSPLVKQDLAKLDTDGDTRRLAVKSLKLFAEQLDASTLPRFISQIAESREPGATRCYAISMYEEVARVHGKLVVPHIPKIMATLVRSAAASGSFPQLQVASARVAAALASHGIGYTVLKDEAEEIMREICSPLIDALAGKLEPVAATAAACIYALAETENWKYAREEMVHDVCQRTAVALSEKATRTAAHMQLIRILASVNPDVLCLHGTSLLRAGEEILKGTANPWQLRKAAAQLLQSVLTILDKETLVTELNSALHALDSCRLDRMPLVRVAVTEALLTAKMLAASGNAETRTSFGMAPIRKSYSDRITSWRPEDPVPTPPASKQGTSPTVAPRSTARVGGSPRAASPKSQESRRLSLSSASTSASESTQALPGISARNLKKGGFMAKRAPLYPARTSMIFARSPRTPRTSPSSSTTTVEECQSQSLRLNVMEFNVQSPITIANGHVFPGKDAAGHGVNSLRPRAPLKEVQDSDFPLPELTTTKSPKFRADSLLTQFASGFENARPNSSSGHVEVVLPRLKLGGVTDSEQQDHSSGESTPMLKDSNISLPTTLPNDSELRDASSHDNEAGTADAEDEKRQIYTPEPRIHAAAADGLQSSSNKHFHKSLANADDNLNFEGKASTKGFLPYLSPMRLVRSLSNLSIAMSETDMKLARHRPSPVAGNPTDADTADTASMESDEEKRGDCAFESSPRLFADCSTREIHVISPSKYHRSPFGFGASKRSPDHEAHHPCLSCVSAEKIFKQTLRSPAKVVDTFSLLHKKESNRLESTNLSKCSEACDQEADADPLEMRSEQGLVPGVTQNWRKRWWYVEIALGGSLALVIALPLAMIIAKTLNELLGESCLLVPT